jgi:hypothetical protein
MAALLPPVRRSRAERWWPYFLLIVVVLFLLWKLAPGSFLSFLDRLSPFHIGTPWISGTVVDAVTGRPVPGIDVCLLATYITSTGNASHIIQVKRSEVTRTDVSGSFFFERWDDQIDWFDKWDGYGIAVTDPVAQWNDVCGHDTYLLGAGIVYGNNDIFQMETYFQSLSDSIAKNPPLPYFPVALVKDPNDPHPEPYRRAFSSFHFPDGALLRKIGNPSKLKIALVPLLRDENECRLAQDSDFAELCRQMNQSPTADALRKSWKLSPQGQ